ncbi:hypothetical protein BLA50215_01976 [Burkholderia lata]|uniref:DUF4148 domain-containing protein n=1 Tax=Burkholderia lata (strain ATCC 17760 / DSM 23089 / LMG 22485 / NCIMB 9086 / R18194 / 383) TaxID=482957 RepID=UPI0014531A1C|nr:DUF4148 domain-containing protein [Burkholderia lata]VWC92080.1 hypothetical protein BLA50215_01976 [Burkholderia lata]
MKVKTIALVFAACAAVSATTSAFASSPVDASVNDQAVGQASQWATAGKLPKGKTRAQVRAELVQAEKDGQLAALDKLYRGS